MRPPGGLGPAHRGDDCEGLGVVGAVLQPCGGVVAQTPWSVIVSAAAARDAPVFQLVPSSVDTSRRLIPSKPTSSCPLVASAWKSIWPATDLGVHVCPPSSLATSPSGLGAELRGLGWPEAKSRSEPGTPVSPMKSSSEAPTRLVVPSAVRATTPV